ncbi:TPA: hypothetical protein ACS72M_003800 [Providencia alcalifaciens]
MFPTHGSGFSSPMQISNIKSSLTSGVDSSQRIQPLLSFAISDVPYVRIPRY